MKKAKVSIIVPIYKVEPYIKKCIESVINQTYENLEIILVDDGSPDSCGIICDEYAQRDTRIRVIHQANKGLAGARNAGLRIAVGDYIGWVDADDWIEPDMYEYLVENIQRYNSDIAVCGHMEHGRSGVTHCGWKNVEVLDTEDALELLLRNHTLQNYVWDKLWRRELFDGIEFPEGRTFEDIAVLHRLFVKAQRLVCLPEEKYNYLLRTGSIVSDRTLGNRINHYIAAKNRYDELSDNWPQFKELMGAQCAASAIGIWCCYLSNPKTEREKYRVQIDDISHFSMQYRKAAKQYISLGVTGKAVLRLVAYTNNLSFALAWVASFIYWLKHNRFL